MLRVTLGAAAILAGTAAHAQITGESHGYTVGDTEFEGYVARNSDLEEPRGTVVIVHDWDGLTEYEERRAEMLAAQGYLVFAADVYGADNRPSSMEENRERTAELTGDRELFRERLMGSIEEARGLEGATEEVVVMGYCFGGGAVLEAARAGADVAGYVSFHGSLATPEGQDYSSTDAPILLLHGTADPNSGPEELAALVSELAEADVEHNAELYGGALHSFTVWGSDDYDVEADRRSWDALNAFLSETF